MCEIYWQTANKSPSAPPTFCGEQHSVRNFEKGDLKGSFHRYLPEGLLCLLCFFSKKDWKTKYGFDDSISYADFGLLQLPNNQLMFNFVKSPQLQAVLKSEEMLLLNMCNMLELSELVVCLRWTC